MRTLYKLGISFVCPHVFLMAILPSFYSLIGLTIWIILAFCYRNIKNFFMDEINGIVSANPKYRKKEEIAFIRLSDEEKKECISQLDKWRKIPILVVLALCIIPYLFGVYMTSFI